MAVAPPLVTRAPAPSVIFVASVMGCSTANAEMTTAPQFKATAVTDLHHSATAPANSRRNTRNGFLINWRRVLSIFSNLNLHLANYICICGRKQLCRSPINISWMLHCIYSIDSLQILYRWLWIILKVVDTVFKRPRLYIHIRSSSYLTLFVLFVFGWNPSGWWINSGGCSRCIN